jgi:hypothetical protein
MDALDMELKKILSKESNLPQGISTKDADTFVAPTGESIRLQGINARETAKFQPGQIKGSQLGADTQTRLMEGLIREGEYTTPAFSGDKSYKREVGELVSPSGTRLTSKALELGYVDPTTSTDAGQYNAMYMGNIERAQRRAERKPTIADALLDTLNKERNAAGFMAKRYTDTASQFGSVVDESGNSDYFSGPSIIRTGEDKYGKATSNWDTGWDQGMGKAAQSLYGSLDLLATKTGNDWLKSTAQAGLNTKFSELSDLPQLKNGEAFDDKGNWQLDSLGKVIDYTIGTAAASSPQMLATIVATLASPATFGTSMIPIAGMYTGQVWNDQKQKNATAAITAGLTMTALDKLSLGFLFKSTGLNITRKSTQDVVLKELEKTMTKEAAKDLLTKSLTESVKEVSDALKVASVKKGIGLKAVGVATGSGALIESGTETLQELTGYFGEQGGFNLPTTPEEQLKLKSRLMNAATGGAILGGALSGAGKTVATLSYNDKLVNTTTDNQFREKYLNEINDKRIDEGKQAFATMPTTKDVIQQTLKSQLDKNTETSLEALAQPEISKRATEGIIAKTYSAIKDKGLAGLYGKFADVIIGDTAHKSIESATLATLLGGSNAVNGSSIETHQVMMETNIFNNFGIAEDLSSAFKGLSVNEASRILSTPTVVNAIKELARLKKDFFSKSTKDIADKANIDYGKYAEYKDAIVEYADKIDNLVNDYNSATEKGLDVRSFMEHKPLDKTLVSKNSSQFVKDLQQNLGMSYADASDLTNAVLNNQQINSFEDALDSMLNGDADKIKGKQELEAKLSKPEFKNKFTAYMSHNMIDNAYSLAASAAAYNTNKEFIGKNGSKLAALIQKMVDNGDIDEQQAGFMAKELQDVLDIRNGKYHAIDNPYLKGALNTINFLSTITSLPLAAISSTVEFAQIYRNLNKPQMVKATAALLKGTGQEFGALYREIGSKVSDRVTIKNSQMRSKLSEAGYLREGGVGYRNDILTSYYQKWTEGFFKITGLTSVTAITRHARLAIAADAIQNWLDVVSKGTGSEQAIADAKDHLRRINVDYEYILSIDADTKSTEKRVIDNLQQATYNFVNEAVVIPSTLNRPKFYSDPYLKLFTQFQGYTSAFTANILPRLISDIRKTGSDDQKNSAAVIAMMLALSMLAIYIKDMIKYNEHPPKWVKDDKEYLRVISQMGILGSGQRVFDQIFPLMEDNKKKSVYETIAAQSPQLSYLNKIEKALTAPQGKQIEQGAKLLPIFGTSPAFAKYLQKELGGSHGD